MRDGRVVGQGFHAQAGQAHAEIRALEEAQQLAVGATMYVTLEPCSHHGRTGPCTEAIVRAGIKEVIVAMLDPNPLVQGSGIARLQEAGIETKLGLLGDEAAELNEAFVTYITKKRPFIHFKTAMSLDGKVACHTGKSQWITGEAAREEVHRLRSLHDAIMVGIGTILADDARLNVRLSKHSDDQPVGAGDPIRIIVDSQGRLPLSARCLDGAGDDATVIVATTEMSTPSFRKALRDRGVRVWVGEPVNGRVPLKTLLYDLALFHITNIFVEAGPTLAGSLFDAQLIDRMTVFIAPLILGGAQAPSPVAGVGADTPDLGQKLHNIKTASFGNDIMITGQLGKG